MVGIIVISCGHFPFTKKCVESIIANTPRYEYRLCLVDNGSLDRTKPWAKSMVKDGWIHNFIDNPKNLGACAAANQGTIWALNHDYDILIVANDHVVTPGWLEPLLRAPSDCANPFIFYSVRFFRDLGGVGILIDHYKDIRIKYLQDDDEAKLEKALLETYGPGGINDYAFEFTDAHNKDPYAKTKMTIWPGFVYYRNYVVENVGLRDENFLKYSLAGGADIDYQYRVYKAGYTNSIAMQSYVHHWGSITTRKNGLKPDKSRFENSNFNMKNHNWNAAIEYLRQKHGFKDINELKRETDWRF